MIGGGLIGGGVACGRVYHLTAVIMGRRLWIAGAKGLVRSAAQICIALRGMKEKGKR